MAEEVEIIDYGDDMMDDAVIRGLERAFENRDKDDKAKLPDPAPPPEGVAVTGKLRRVDAGVARAAQAKLRHYGPGPHPGTGTPQEVHGDGGGSTPGAGQITADGGRITTTAGITSYRPGREYEQVFQEMRDFESRMRGFAGVTNLSVRPGVGGWDHGTEPTWIVEYEGNGQALAEMASTAKAFNQDGVLIMHAAGTEEVSGLGSLEPVVDWTFDEHLTPSERRDIEGLLDDAAEGNAGWTWLRGPQGERILRFVNVPDWTGRSGAEHLRLTDEVSADLSAAGFQFGVTNQNVSVRTMNREGPNSYDSYIGG